MSQLALFTDLQPQPVERDRLLAELLPLCAGGPEPIEMDGGDDPEPPEVEAEPTIKDDGGYWKTIRGCRMTVHEAVMMRSMGWTPHVAKAYGLGHPWSDPAAYPDGENAGFRPEGQYDEPESWGHPFDKKLPRKPEARRDYLKRALKHVEQERARDLAGYEKYRKAALEDPENPVLGINEALGLKYAHLTADNSRLRAIRFQLTGEKQNV